MRGTIILTTVAATTLLLSALAGCSPESEVEHETARDASAEASDQDDTRAEPRRERRPVPVEHEEPAVAPSEPASEPEPTADERAAASSAEEAWRKQFEDLVVAADGPAAVSLEDLVSVARTLESARGASGLFAEQRHLPRDAPPDAELRGWVVEFGETREAARAWALAQRIRFEDHRHYGSIWMHDSTSWSGMQEHARHHPEPLWRALAIDALGAHGGVARDALLGDPDERVRATAARHLDPPDGATLAEAERITQAVAALVRSPDAVVRRLAVPALARWSYAESHRELLTTLALSDPDLGVRLAAVRAAGSLGLEHAWELIDRVRAARDVPPELAAVLDEFEAGLPVVR